jgi:hypothetical protein
MSNEDRLILSQCVVAMAEITQLQLELHNRIQVLAGLLATMRLRKETEATPHLTRIK